MRILATNRYKREMILGAAIVVLYFLPLFGPAAAYFYTFDNLRNLVIDNLPILLMAGGMTAIVVAAQIDISIGSQYLVCGLAAGWTAGAGAPMWLVTAAVLAAGLAMGAINGLLVSCGRIAAIVATLATMTIWRQGVMWWTAGAWIQNLPRSFTWYGLPQKVGQGLYVAVAFALFAFLAWAMRNTSFGRSFYAVGCSPEASRRLGLRPGLVLARSFMLMGALTAVAALMNFTRYSSVEANAGLGIEMRVIAAVVVGGTAVTGGKGSLFGTLLGVMLTCSIGTILTFLHIEASWEHVVQGFIILTAVVLDTVWREEG